jgi:protein-S-isoprenylcysteine O-methyltransferase Ste14
MKPSPDTPGVLVFPPLIPLSTLLIGTWLNRVLPLNGLSRVERPWRLAGGGLAMLAGAAVLASGARALMRLGTPIRPSQTTLAIATEGVFDRTRNPMYVGGGLAFAGLAIALASDWVLLLLLPSFLLLHNGVVVPEERYLERRFGEPYRRYKARVPRYGWRF